MSDIFSLFGTPQIQWIMTLIGVDVILAVAAALTKKEFEFGKLGNFMKGPVLGYVLGFAVVEMVGEVIPSLGFVVPGVFVLVLVALLASIVKNLAKLGLPVPKVLRK